MNRTGLAIAIITAVVVGVIFAIYPELDILISRALFDRRIGNFPMRLNHFLHLAQHAATWLAWLLVATPVLALLVKLVLPRTRLMVPGRAIVLMLSSLALAPGLLTNVVLKEHWHRPRPIETTVFGGTRTFVPWWDPRGTCPHNCSFVSGDVSMAAWTISAAAVAPPTWRALAYAGAFAFTAATAAARLVLGAHFFTDVTFAAVFTFLLIWLLHGLIYRWGAARLSDERIERALERAGRWCRRLLGGAAGRPRTEP